MTESRMFRVGLTGGIGSGKSTVAERFQHLGAALVDTDVIAHRLTAPEGAAIPAIRECFGDSMITSDGRLDRAAMRALVFTQPEARSTLESILHPMIRAVAEEEVAAAARAGAAYVLLAIPLLVEAGQARNRVERVLVVDCPEAVQVARVTKRSGLAPQEVEAIIRAQASREQRLQAADDVIDNGGDESRLDPQVQPLHQQYLVLGQAWARQASGE
ncbi:MAG TPA: dephospho-CoA kinase [Lautropia sp.]|nr:dephospho-CoA kinase [Lautropia sp.]